MNLRHLIAVPLLSTLLLGCSQTTSSPQSANRDLKSTTPVILDTDIGNDIDDTWALAMLLRTPSLGLKLVTTTDGQPEYRARLVAKLLSTAGRSDVPIAIGPVAGKPNRKEREASWLGDYKLADYKGAVHKDGVRALIDTIHASKEPITIIAIGPLQTLAAALDADPSIAAKCDLIGMQGAVFKGYNGSPKPTPEFNVVQSIPSAQKVLSAPWRSITITPLDTCGLPGVSFAGADFKRLKDSQDPLVRAILASYASWAQKPDPAALDKSTVLYDTVAVYLAEPNHSLLQLLTHPIAVDDTGMTLVSPAGRSMSIATDWTDLAAYRAHLLNTLLAPAP